ncbi:hypothetical protein WM41_0266 [Corynebacterium simulans]|uniref:Uncharacterized protein n=1 Tax=Corynebacterium simulans TaxID=146827 RepID=A0ABN0CIW5_9CORY|nr:hypothetical protein WM41_0266 [Corynebacterium simulans]
MPQDRTFLIAIRFALSHCDYVPVPTDSPEKGVEAIHAPTSAGST